MKPTPVFLAALLWLVAARASAELPAWIWRHEAGRPSPAGERAYFTRTFTYQGKAEKVQLKAACAGHMDVWVNGKAVATSPELRQPVTKELPPDLFHWGDNTVAVFGRTTADHTGLVLQLTIDGEYGKNVTVQTDGEWRVALDNPPGWNQPGSAAAAAWEKATLLGRLGDAPWGDVFTARAAGATPAAELTVPPGFRIELLRSAGPREGSWVCMTVDDTGRLYICPQQAVPESGFARDSGWGGIFRATIDEKGNLATWERVPVPIGGCMGMLWTGGVLFLSGQGPEGHAIYRCTDTDGDSLADAWTVFKKVPGGGGEHGAHAIVQGPDGHLYIAMGNSTPLVEGLAPDSPFRHWHEDDLLPRIKDPVATFFDDLKAPYGHILRTDAEGKKWELWCAGLRNAYDIDFDASGQLFTYDSDMEWDVGLPWYRPTRILKLVPGGEYGFREGSAKMPASYPDTVPAVADIGLGSPTGVKFGTRSHFPGKWKRALYAMDWTYGRILAVHPSVGAWSFEDFAKGPGLPVTDLEFGKDGAMYFTVGGRGTQGGLYRVSAMEPTPADAPVAPPPAPAPPRESFGPQAPAEAQAAVDRLAAGNAGFSPSAVRSLQLALARFPEVKKSPAAAQVATRLDGLWRTDAQNFPLARELSQLLVALDWPGVVEPSLAGLEGAHARWVAGGKKLPDPLKLGPQEESIWFARVLCEVPAERFTAGQRARYFAWFAAAREFKGGNSFVKFLDAIRDRALAKLPENERAAVLATLEAAPAPSAPEPAAPERKFIRNWTVAELEPHLGALKAGRNFERGREIYSSMLCAKCHRFADRTEGNVGPDLTAVGGRFSAKDIAEAVIDPSKSVSEQYASFVFTKKDGTALSGQLVEEKPHAWVLYGDPFGYSKVEVAKADVARREAATVSMMPAGLFNNLQLDEVLDVIAYLQSAGDKSAPAFKTTP